MRESPAEASEDSQNDSKPQTQDTSQNSNSETDSKTFAEFDSTLRFRKGFRRKKGESPYVQDSFCWFLPCLDLLPVVLLFA